MYSITRQNDDTTYSVIQAVIDIESDIVSLPTSWAPGSRVFCIASSTTYMLNNAKNWIQISSSGSGTADYNALTHKPIENKMGTSTNPVVFSTLAVGSYVIRGDYIYTSLDTQVKHIGNQLHLDIVFDTVRQENIAKYESFEDGELYAYAIVLHANDTYYINRIHIKDSASSTGIIFTTEQDLPPVGVDSVIYVTEQSIYRWQNNNYIALGGQAIEDSIIGDPGDPSTADTLHGVRAYVDEQLGWATIM